MPLLVNPCAPRTRLIALALATALGTAAPALAQDDPINFGDDSSPWANDGECDDPRFEGPGMTSTVLRDVDRRRDATDCRTAYEDGELTFLGDDAGPSAEPAGPSTIELGGRDPVDIADIDFGDDSSVWAEDGECDDPRFIGEGVALGANRGNLMADATDCRAMVEQGLATYAGDMEPMFEGVHEDIDFGDNSGSYPDDGECDDPRFSGSGVAFSPRRSEAGRDAHDCRQAYDMGTASFDGELEPVFEGVYDDIDFGDNSGNYPEDGECDDPRFSGDGVAFSPLREDVGRDAQDCYETYLAGTASYDGELEPLFEGVHNDIDFGDNSGDYPDDQECDDPRFQGEAMAYFPERASIRRDAHDCYTAYVDGMVKYEGELEPLFSGVFDDIDFGDNSGPYTEDGECDDPRFRGFGMAFTPLSDESEYRDAHDCQGLYDKGFIRYVMMDGMFEGEFDGIDFGNNSGDWVNDGECDDARFEGPGMGSEDGGNDMRDAHDCKLNYEEGSIILRVED